eukprot:gene51288-34140_t
MLRGTRRHIYPVRKLWGATVQRSTRACTYAYAALDLHRAEVMGRNRFTHSHCVPMHGLWDGFVILRAAECWTVSSFHDRVAADMAAEHAALLDALR